MYDVKYVGWDDGTSLYHYGIKGQKWGERRYQNPDGSLTAEGRARYLKQTFGNEHGYQSRATRDALRSGGKDSNAYKSNKAYDKAITDYYANSSRGKNFLKDYLLSPQGAMTYNMARAAGEGRGQAFVRSVFDLNAATWAGSTLSGAISRDATKKQMEGRELSTKDNLKIAAGTAANYGVQYAMRNSGDELSLQQRALRKRYADRKYASSRF